MLLIQKTASNRNLRKEELRGLVIHLFANKNSRGRWSRFGRAAPQCSLGEEIQAPSLSLLSLSPWLPLDLKLDLWCGMAAEAPDITYPF